MIHIAPCSCELHVRIRELEAAIAVYQDAEPIWRKRVTELEAELALAETTKRNHEVQFALQGDRLREWIARAEKAEAAIKVLDVTRASRLLAERVVELQELAERQREWEED